MKKRFFLKKIQAFFIGASLLFPAPSVQALRTTNAGSEESQVPGELRRALTAGVEQQNAGNISTPMGPEDAMNQVPDLFKNGQIFTTPLNSSPRPTHYAILTPDSPKTLINKAVYGFAVESKIGAVLLSPRLSEDGEPIIVVSPAAGTEANAGPALEPVVAELVDQIKANPPQSGLEALERWQGMRSAAEGAAAVVIGRSVAEPFGGLKELARLDGGKRIYADEGPETALQVLQSGAEEVVYYGGLEEARIFGAMLEGALPVGYQPAARGPFLLQLERILFLAGVPRAVVDRGIADLAGGLEATSSAA